MLIARVLWESCWIELGSSFLNLSAPILGLSVDLRIPQKKLLCLRSPSRGVLKCFKAVFRVIHLIFFLMKTPRWLHSEHKCSCQLSAQHGCCPWSYFMVCGFLCLIPRLQTHRREFCILPRENRILNIIYWLPGTGVSFWS